jgi:hypothetical protein
MASDQQIIDLVRKAFETGPRPAHFTNYMHCCECAEHDDVLCSRDITSLRVEDVNNAAWDPICFLTTEGFRYYLPALVRLALESSTSQDSWYLPQLLFHLIGDDPHNHRVAGCTASQQGAMAAFLWHEECIS